MEIRRWHLRRSMCGVHWTTGEFFEIHLRNQTKSIVLCSVVKHAGSVRARKKCDKEISNFPTHSLTKQRYNILHSRTIKSNMAVLIALSERKCISYDVLHRLSTADILYAGNRRKKRSQLKYKGFYVSVFSKQKELQTFLVCFDTANLVRTSFFPRVEI